MNVSADASEARGATSPRVSVLMVTYNHERFIAQAIESALMQKTNFDYEIVIGEDCSTDSTREIVRDYARRHRDKIRLLLHDTNIGPDANFERTLAACHGEYIAILEGDDYWTNVGKLQIQASLLDKRSEVALVSHKTCYVCEDGTPIADRKSMESGELEYRDTDVLTAVFDHPNSWLFRRVSLPPKIMTLRAYLSMGDDILCLHFLQNGKTAISLPDVWSCYRQHSGGMWSTLGSFQRCVQQYLLLLAQKRLYSPHYDKQYTKLLRTKRRAIANLLLTDLTRGRILSIPNNLFYLAQWRHGIFFRRRDFGFLLLVVALYAPLLFVQKIWRATRRAAKFMCNKLSPTF